MDDAFDRAEYFIALTPMPKKVAETELPRIADVLLRHPSGLLLIRLLLRLDLGSDIGGEANTATFSFRLVHELTDG